MPSAFSIHPTPFPDDADSLRRLNQHLSQTYGTQGWTLAALTPTADQSTLVFCFQKQYADPPPPDESETLKSETTRRDQPGII